MFVGRVCTVIFVDEVRQITELKLDSGAYVMAGHSSSATASSDGSPMIDATLMIIGQIEDEKV